MASLPLCQSRYREQTARKKHETQERAGETQTLSAPTAACDDVWLNEQNSVLHVQVNLALCDVRRLLIDPFFDLARPCMR